ncbi:unnamed protein product [Rotaria magnacalcarata]|uniref:Uncharacterized protein n=1 Tax=Rotaria magnacalcarata TaxID=392030 RepID=A0A820LTH8_9BILA|nr:unnamed protein product [Rotaria magnacalcarata]CAF2165651.1 unnamed protein product [Rotaria magnacalcarata]CAF4226848.1 unnamed protein product [Rotaria magnacalcarata]CAF4362002.1 unnamed protein product [Rotaria magnacalcarata]
MDPTINNSGEIKNDFGYLRTAPMQTVSSSIHPIQAPPPPPYEVALPPSTMYSSYPVAMPHMAWPSQIVIVNNNQIPMHTAHIQDYMVWSIINIIVGCIAGVIALVFSFQTRRRKQEGDLKGAMKMSKITLVANILITIMFFIMAAFLIVYFVYIMSFLKNID